MLKASGKIFQVDIGTLDGEEHSFYAKYTKANIQGTSIFKELDEFNFEHEILNLRTNVRFETSIVWYPHNIDPDETWKQPKITTVRERMATVTINAATVSWVRVIYQNEEDETEDDE